MLKEVADTDLANFDSWRPAVDENISLVSPNSDPDQSVEKGFVPNAIHPELPVERIHSSSIKDERKVPTTNLVGLPILIL